MLDQDGKPVRMTGLDFRRVARWEHLPDPDPVPMTAIDLGEIVPSIDHMGLIWGLLDCYRYKQDLHFNVFNGGSSAASKNTLNNNNNNNDDDDDDYDDDDQCCNNEDSDQSSSAGVS